MLLLIYGKLDHDEKENSDWCFNFAMFSVNCLSNHCTKNAFVEICFILRLWRGQIFKKANRKRNSVFNFDGIGFVTFTEVVIFVVLKRLSANLYSGSSRAFLCSRFQLFGFRMEEKSMTYFWEAYLRNFLILYGKEKKTIATIDFSVCANFNHVLAILTVY